MTNYIARNWGVYASEAN